MSAYYSIEDILTEADNILSKYEGNVGSITYSLHGEATGTIKVYSDGSYRIDIQRDSDKKDNNVVKESEAIEPCELRNKDKCNTYYDAYDMCEYYYTGECSNDNCSGFDKDCEDYKPIKSTSEGDVHND